jgi:hypothetical protein
MRSRAAGFAAALVLACGVFAVPAPAQEADWGFSVPMTLTTRAMVTRRPQSYDPGAAPAAFAVRGMAYPTFRLGTHWFGYGAVQVHSTPFFYEEAFSSRRELKLELVQGFAGYSSSVGKTTLMVKAGRLVSAFGSFPLRYDDAQNPVLDLPQPYGYYYKPVSMEGLLGVEVDVARDRFDARVQVTDSSPAHVSLNPKKKAAQWAAGAGWTVHQGLRIGVSAYRGTYLEPGSVWLVPGDRSEQFPATGVGLDVQWAAGRWSAQGEFQRFDFPYPHDPSATGYYGYVEAKAALTPRLYAAGRAGFQHYNWVAPSLSNYEIALGYRPGRDHLLKVGYLWSPSCSSMPVMSKGVLGVQYVASVRALSHAFR